MQQVEIIAHLAAAAHDAEAIIVAEIGSQSQWLYATGDDPSHLYLTGPMGMAPSVAMGVALACPDIPVLAICGDGSLAMNLNALVTLSHHAPQNLTLALMDNGVYELTGSITSPTAGVDWQTLIEGLPGFAHYDEVDLDSDITFDVNRGMTFWHARLEPSTQKAPPFPLAPGEIHRRIKQYLSR